ncbi:hypothetical protein EVJ58_g1253 [Rhodofomes roseus]|uniref:Uncharacterized protein n=1 Tax=Rhodofomes roseus TaxID=34475 RepID=A0A4Y9Z2C3_9APHY|nr:hypothetical protein EVJ58_g1253 [Rhodofomes roseus]
MRFSILPSLVALAASPLALAQVYVVTDNSQQFDNPSSSVDTLACAAFLQDYQTIGNIPGNLAGFSNVTSDISLCDQCVTLGWQGREVVVRIVDTSPEEGFEVTEGAYEQLVGGPLLPGVYQAEIVSGPDSCLALDKRSS